MGNLPQIDRAVQIPLHLSTPGHLMDHHFMGQPVLPAVVAMEVLARTAKQHHPSLAVNHMAWIRFDKFMPMDPARTQLEAIVELQLSEDGHWQAALITRSQAPKAAITRSKVHARLVFDQSKASIDSWPLDVAAVPEGICLSVSPETIYSQLVPFGPAFQNIVSPVYVSPDGALACIKTPGFQGAADDHCLGSPYALDAALHGACVWAQHYKGIVAFPVAMDERIVIRPTRSDSICYGRIKLRSASNDLLLFDLCLMDEQGALCEMVRGIHMRDVSGGRLRPPDWIIRSEKPDPLVELKNNCQGLTAIELAAVPPFASRALTSQEAERFARMGPRRQKSFLAARLALKRLYRNCRRNCPEDAATIPAQRIETVHAHSPLPCCGPSDSRDGVRMHCSVSHDRRFAVAVSHDNPVGIDVEELSGKALKSGRIYMGPEELRLVEQYAMGAQDAALRVWSIKEAAAKAFGMNLAAAWQAVQVTLIDDLQSCFIMEGQTMTARHARVDEDLITLIVKP